MVGLQRFFAQPVHDYVDALTVCFRGGRVQTLLIVAVAFLLAWWIYVPIHELSHSIIIERFQNINLAS